MEIKTLAEYTKTEDLGQGFLRKIYLFEGHEYESLDSLIQHGFLEFCGCGVIGGIVPFIYEMFTLHLINQEEKAPATIGKEWEEYCKKQKERVKNYICENWEDVEWFFWYFMNQKGFCQHGGNVSNGYMDDNFVEILKAWKKEHEENENGMA